MPPSTLNVRNGWPTIASTAASQIQMVVATTRPRRVPSHTELCCVMTSCSFPERGGGTGCPRRGLSRVAVAAGRWLPPIDSRTFTGEPAQETRPSSLVFQLLGTAHSVTDRLAEALAELGLST